MLRPGDVVLVDFAGATGIKRRPAVVISSETYHTHRPDVIVGVLTTRVSSATSPTDHVLEDWEEAGLHAPSAFRAYLGTVAAEDVKTVGRLSQRDWKEVQKRLQIALSLD
ncbi:MAG: type II toxin-antitoxin system PemK/MazF family toxin [Armatimonadota bacterium]